MPQLRALTPSILPIAAVLLCACAKPDTSPPSVEPAADGPTDTSKSRVDTSLIPRDVLFGNPDKVGPSLSPDGSKLLYLAPVDGVMNVWVGNTSDGVAAAKPITQDKKRGIRFAGWTWGADRVIYIQDRDGDENWHVYAADPQTGESKDITPIQGVQAQLVGSSQQFPDDLLIGLNDRDPAYHDVYKVNVKTGDRKLIQKNEDKYAGFSVDEQYRVRFAFKATPDGGMEFYAKQGKKFKLTEKIERDDMLATSMRGFNKKGTVAYWADSRGRETAALVAVDLKTGKKTVVAEDPTVNVGGTLSDAKTHEPMAVAFNHQRRRWQILDDKIKPDFEYLKTVRADDFVITDQTADDSKWLVAYFSDAGPARYYYYDRGAKQATLLFSSRAALEDLPLTPMHPVVIKSRDGLDLVSYLSLPKKSDEDGDARPDKPLPLVLTVHGGPWGRDTWGFNPYHQWLADRGYAVLSVNFRGSTGFTKSFANAGDHEWAGKMHDDLLDAVKWAVDNNIANPDKVAIMGGSYGGYATLVGLTFTPDVFACGVDIVGPSNLVTLLQTIPPYWASLKATFAQRVGDPDTEEGRKELLARSPLSKVDQIKKPLLIGQGANDPRVKQAEADQIVKAMQDKQIPVTYVLYPDEGHGFARPENNKSFNAITEAFLSECLGGSYLPVGNDFEGSSLKVPAGAELVPGLAESLK